MERGKLSVILQYIDLEFFLVIVDCQWNGWQSWSSCSKSCGGGMRTQNRRKSVNENYGGKCTGGSSKEESCNTHNCPSKIILLFFYQYLPNATLKICSI